jgi:hypothetical protein
MTAPMRTILWALLVIILTLVAYDIGTVINSVAQQSVDATFGLRNLLAFAGVELSIFIGIFLG